MHEVAPEPPLFLAFGPLAALLIVGTGIALILQAKQLARGFMVGAVTSVVLFHIGPTLLPEIPVVLILVVLPLILLALLGQFFSLFVGRRAADVAIGNLLSNLVILVLVLLTVPFKYLRRLLERSSSP